MTTIHTVDFLNNIEEDELTNEHPEINTDFIVDEHLTYNDTTEEAFYIISKFNYGELDKTIFLININVCEYDENDNGYDDDYPEGQIVEYTRNYFVVETSEGLKKVEVLVDMYDGTSRIEEVKDAKDCLNNSLYNQIINYEMKDKIDNF